MEARQVTVRAIASQEAAHALAGLESLDPRGLMAPGDVESVAANGRCFALEGDASAVYVLTVRNDVCWVEAVRGGGDVDVTAILDSVLTEQARGLAAIALQTARRGLVRKLQKRGYRVTGWVMRKELG